MSSVSILNFPKKALLIINPVSGKRAVIRYVPQIIRSLMDGGYLVSTMVTAHRGEATELAARYGRDYDLVCCTGGDGTLNEVLTGLAREEISVPLGYIPCGSTNDFAVSRHLSADIPTAAGNVASGRIRQYDIGRFGDHYFAYVAAFGAFSWLSYTTDQNLKNLLGHTAYLLDGIKDLSKIKPLQLRLSADGEVHEGDYLFGAVANSTSIAGTITLPEELVDTCDGRFEVLLIRVPKTIVDLEEIVLGILMQDYSSELIEFFHASHIIAESPIPLEWTVDGEYPGQTERVEITPVPGFLRLQG